MQLDLFKTFGQCSWSVSVSDGRQERIMFDKITSRIQKLCYGLNSDFVDPVSQISQMLHVLRHATFRIDIIKIHRPKLKMWSCSL